MIIPYQELEKETLHNLVAEFVSRDGTDNGYEQDLDNRIDWVIHLLKKGEAAIIFDTELESAQIVSKEAASKYESL